MSPQWNLPYIDKDPQVCQFEKPLLTGQSTVSPSTLYPSSWHSFSAHPVAKITCASSEDSCIHVIVSKIVQTNPISCVCKQAYTMVQPSGPWSIWLQNLSKPSCPSEHQVRTQWSINSGSIFWGCYSLALHYMGVQA